MLLVRDKVAAVNQNNASELKKPEEASGLCPFAEVILSPNCSPRPAGHSVDSIVIHCISLPRGDYSTNAVVDFFQNKLDITQHASLDDLRALKVSAHFFIRRDGQIIQCVNTHVAAWHAGLSSFEGRDGWNKFSVGIELEGTDDTPFEPAQYASLYNLIDWLLETHPAIKTGFIQGHEHIAPGRKTDPGLFFNWSGLREQLSRRGEQDIMIAGG